MNTSRYEIYLDGRELLVSTTTKGEAVRIATRKQQVFQRNTVTIKDRYAKDADRMFMNADGSVLFNESI